MDQKVRAAIVYDRGQPCNALRRVLRHLDLEVRDVHNCREAASLLDNPGGPEIVFTEEHLTDGTWRDVVQLARQSRDFLPVVVVARVADTELYLRALEGGAFAVVAPPFLSNDLASVTGSAMYKKLLSRELQPLLRA